MLAARSISKWRGSNTVESKKYTSLQSHFSTTCGKMDFACKDFNRMQAGYGWSRCKATLSLFTSYKSCSSVRRYYVFCKAALAQTIQERVKSSAEDVGMSWSCSTQPWGCTKGFWSIWESPQTFTGTSVLYGHSYTLHAWYLAGFRLTLPTQDCNSSRPLVPEQALNNAYIP